MLCEEYVCLEKISFINYSIIKFEQNKRKKYFKITAGGIGAEIAGFSKCDRMIKVVQALYLVNLVSNGADYWERFAEGVFVYESIGRWERPNLNKQWTV